MSAQEAIIGVCIMGAGFVPAIVGLLKIAERKGKPEPRWVGLAVVGVAVVLAGLIYFGVILFASSLAPLPLEARLPPTQY